MPSPLPAPGSGAPARVQQLLRWVWLAVGVVVLVLLVWIVVFMVRESAGGGASSPADSARDETAARVKPVEPLRYDSPRTITGTATRIVLVQRGSGYRYSSRAESRASTGEGPTVNVAFMEGDGARLLLDRPAYIRDVTFPGGGADADSLRWIVYEMALEDVDENGMIDESDARSLYVTGLDGRGLRRVLPPGYELRAWVAQPGGGLVITAVRLTTDSRAMPERAFILDAAGAVRPYAALDSVVDAAARIAGKP